ncbi:MAG: hypothetical protein WBA41_33860 [Rivularia sp. (in: cyanobacteria)]
MSELDKDNFYHFDQEDAKRAAQAAQNAAQNAGSSNGGGDMGFLIMVGGSILGGILHLLGGGE